MRIYIPPTPGDVIGEGTAEKGSHDRRNTVCRSEKTEHHRQLVRRAGKLDDDERSRNQAGETNADDGATGDEGRAVLGDPCAGHLVSSGTRVSLGER